jgi:hypothetical protein
LCCSTHQSLLHSTLQREDSKVSELQKDLAGASRRITAQSHLQLSWMFLNLAVLP